VEAVLPLTLAALALLLGAAWRGIFAGYPPPRFVAAALNAKEQAVLLACADTLFPDRAVMPLTGGEAGVVEYLDAHLAALPPSKQTQLRLLFAFIEHAPWLIGPGGPSRRFTALPPAQRTAFLLRLSLSNVYFLRVCFLSLRTLTCLAYLHHPAIVAAVGCVANQRPYPPGAAP
jgi:hypothetical protein